MRAAAALIALAALSRFPQFQGATEPEALRVAGRIDRARFATGRGGMSAGELQEWARRRRRAAITHPGKRR